MMVQCPIPFAAKLEAPVHAGGLARRRWPAAGLQRRLRQLAGVSARRLQGLALAELDLEPGAWPTCWRACRTRRAGARASRAAGLPGAGGSERFAELWLSALRKAARCWKRIRPANFPARIRRSRCRRRCRRAEGLAHEIRNPLAGP
jgi:nitrogen-specific signal transduction histidine kinase